MTKIKEAVMMERGLGRSKERPCHMALWETTDSDDCSLQNSIRYSISIKRS